MRTVPRIRARGIPGGRAEDAAHRGAVRVVGHRALGGAVAGGGEHDRVPAPGVEAAGTRPPQLLAGEHWRVVHCCGAPRLQDLMHETRCTEVISRPARATMRSRPRRRRARASFAAKRVTDTLDRGRSRPPATRPDHPMRPPGPSSPDGPARREYRLTRPGSGGYSSHRTPGRDAPLGLPWTSRDHRPERLRPPPHPLGVQPARRAGADHRPRRHVGQARASTASPSPTTARSTARSRSTRRPPRRASSRSSAWRPTSPGGR